VKEDEQPTTAVVATLLHQSELGGMIVNRSCDEACKRNADKVATLLARYERACAEEDSAAAHKYATEALALDPTCFSDHGKPGAIPSRKRIPERVHGGVQ
jgi:hypothetical protein